MTQTSPSTKRTRRRKTFNNSSNVGNALYREVGIKQKFVYMREATIERWVSNLSRFKDTIGWHVGGWTERYEERRVGISDDYVRALLDLEDNCRYIALNGTGPVSTALRERMTKSGLL